MLCWTWVFKVLSSVVIFNVVCTLTMFLNRWNFFVQKHGKMSPWKNDAFWHFMKKIFIPHSDSKPQQSVQQVSISFFNLRNLPYHWNFIIILPVSRQLLNKAYCYNQTKFNNSRLSEKNLDIGKSAENYDFLLVGLFLQDSKTPFEVYKIRVQFFGTWKFFSLGQRSDS